MNSLPPSTSPAGPFAPTPEQQQRLQRSYTTTTTVSFRPKTFLEKQPYMFGYGAMISLVSPTLTAYQLCKLYNIKGARSSMPQLARMSLAIFPHQTCLKVMQMNASTPVREYLNPFAAFGLVGILQGAIYGQCNVHYGRVLKISKTTASVASMFRGSGFACFRDMISQGVPFVVSDSVRTSVVEPIFKSKEETETNSVHQWIAVISTSIFATYASQGLHNLQIAMQTNTKLGYVETVKSVYANHGWRMAIKGAEARIGLLLLVNVLNEVVLKPAWAPVQV